MLIYTKSVGILKSTNDLSLFLEDIDAYFRKEADNYISIAAYCVPWGPF